MCGRFTLASPQKITTRFNTKNDLPIFQASYNIAPGIKIPVVTRNSPNRVSLVNWGVRFTPKSPILINLRAETIIGKPFFRHLFAHNRCLIIADSFYEWGEVVLENKAEKYPFNFYFEGRPLFGFAGILIEQKNRRGKSDYGCAIITTQAIKPVAPIHHRMPVIIEKNNEPAWLDNQNTEIEKVIPFLSSPANRRLWVDVVSKQVNNPEADGPDLIKPKKTSAV